MSILSQLNSPFLYIVCGAIILFIAAVSLFFLIRAYRAGKAMGIDQTTMIKALGRLRHGSSLNLNFFFR